MAGNGQADLNHPVPRPPVINHSHTFGDQQVTPEERDRRMQDIFHRLAPYYDRLLDVQSLGLHRYWRRVMVNIVAPQPGQRILDVAGGCGEMAKRFAGPDHQTIVLEPSLPMMNTGRSCDAQNVDWVAGEARALPFPDESIDTVSCAFGFRNVTYVEEGMKEVLRVLAPGGRLVCLEVSRPRKLIQPLFYAYCRFMVPRLGSLIVRIPEAYEYLVASIERFPDQEEIKNLMESMGFVDVSCHSLSLGVARIHVGTKA